MVKTKPKTKRRFKSGTVAIRDVKKQQKSGYELAICHDGYAWFCHTQIPVVCILKLVNKMFFKVLHGFLI